MPGLFGYLCKEKSVIEPKLLETMADSMRHQPDLHVEISSYAGFGAGRVHLGFFDSEVQPNRDATNQYSIWVDGEFTNAAELQQSYKCNEATVASHSALALELYLRAGWDFLPHVDGIFTIALYDHLSHHLTLVNDRYGLRPLYWIETSSGFAYAGEVKALLKVPEVALDIDPLSVREFFSHGQLLGNRTWIEGIQLLPSATIMHMTEDRIEHQRYWSWSDIQDLPENSDIEEVVEEMGRLWLRAVERQVDDKSLGQLLSGGLDSRAILAALPSMRHPYRTLTFGLLNSDDDRIARQVAHIKGVEHHFVEIDSVNWLSPRIDAVWRTDGMLRILDLHGAEAQPLMNRLWQINLHGFAGDAIAGASLFNYDARSALKKKLLISGGLATDIDTSIDYLSSFVIGGDVPIDATIMEQRVRRFTNCGLIAMSSYAESRLPFYDYPFFSFCFAIPNSLRLDSYAYRKMLLRFFPAYYSTIPWQNTGLPIWPSSLQQGVKNVQNFTERGLRYSTRLLRLPISLGRKSFTDYPVWLRTQSTQRFVTKLMGKDALYHNYVDGDRAHGIVRDFMENKSRNQDLATVGLLLTFEIYLRQLMDPTSLASAEQLLHHTPSHAKSHGK